MTSQNEMNTVTDSSAKLLGRFQLRNIETSKVYILARQLETLGSKEKNTIILQGDGVSRYHCKVEIKDGRWRVKDLDSRNGIQLSSSPNSGFSLVKEEPLRSGNVIQIGDVELIFEERGAEQMQPVEAEISEDSLNAIAAFQNPKLKPIIGAAALLVVIVIGVLIYSGSAKENTDGPVKSTDSFETYEEAIVYVVEKLEAGDLALARKVIVKVADKYEKEAATKHLAVIVDLAGKQDSPRDFPWDKYLKSLAQLQDLNVPVPVEDFAKSRIPLALMNRTSYMAVKDGERWIEEARAEANKGRVIAAVQKYHKALLEFRKVAPQSVFSGDSVKSFKRIQETIYSSLYEEAETNLNRRDWPEARRFYKNAVSYAANQEAKNILLTKIEQCNRNVIDEGVYSRAVEIISRKDVRSYPRALKLLRSINKKSEIFESAKSWADWCEADLSMRQAVACFSKADGDNALSWLDKTIKSKGIQENTRQQLVLKRRFWREVISAYDDGNAALDKSSFDIAKSKFNWILEKLASKDNVYRRLAEAKLNEINRERNLSPNELLGRAKSALEDGQYEVAHRLFQRARIANKGSKAFEQKVSKLVDGVEKKFKLLLIARKIVLESRRNEFDTARGIARLLKDFLAPGDRRQKRAVELYQKLKKK
ncbi:MAG: FHA domain-containing protein [Planctomycetota bacterium]|nr:FHA domain-containing protein [Planctomycetota bacterium]